MAITSLKIFGRDLDHLGHVTS